MFAGYGAMITRLYHHIRSTANNIISNVSRSIGGFSSVIIGILLDVDVSGPSTVTLFPASLYLVSLVAMFFITSLKTHQYKTLGADSFLS